MSTETPVAAPAAATPPALPAQRVDAFGQARVDYKTIALLALPLMLNSGLQAIVSLTDTWFVGHISTSAIAAMGAVYWVVLLFLVLIGGVGFAVQTFVAQAEGSRRRWRASHATWIAIWAALLSLPIYAALAWAGLRIALRCRSNTDSTSHRRRREQTRDDRTSTTSSTPTLHNAFHFRLLMAFVAGERRPIGYSID